MSNTWIKMCGLKQRAEIEIAVELGVDAVGLVFYAPSVRNIGINEIDELLTCELKGTKVVALFVNPSREEVEAVLSSGRIDLLQFHGCEEPEFCESFEVPYLKALGVEASVDTEEIEANLHRYQSAQYFLLDTFDAQDHGGTGTSFDWSQAAALSAAVKQKMILAGGLNPQNVGDAINRVKPFGVDVSSGIEAAKGRKDIFKMKQFYEGVRRA
ncbi:MAG: phosphoribosylanthranilate isomerase [Pseudomonadales bacterium]|nr:phosphoribosylanthranilate isomerase [Pseudomonadales bacterium]